MPLPLKDRDLQRFDGAARVAVTGAGGQVRLTDLYQSSPCKAMFPLIDGRPWREAVLLNTAGGVAGGDRLRYQATASGDACLILTTQAAERVYRALDAPGVIETRLEARDAATLEWLPQETILFDGGRLHRTTAIHASGSARILALEWLTFGRAASGEQVRCGAVRDRWRVFRDDRLVWADDLRLDGDIAGLLVRAPLLGGCGAIASLLYLGPDAEDRRDPARVLLADLPCEAGATLVNGMLLCRFAARRAAALRQAVAAFLAGFRGGWPKIWAC